MFDAVIPFFNASNRIVVLTGAGVSAESGIPTFREAQTGLWAQFDISELATPEAFVRHPDRVWQWYAWRRDLIANCEPNPGHHALVEMESLFPDFLLVTQNVDGLHRIAGNQQVVELHGNIQRCKCFSCGRIAEQWDRTAQTPPTCQHCPGRLRPDVVWFNEQLDGATLDQALNAAATADLVLSIGTSSLVTPAAYIPQIALQANIPVIEINPNPTPLTPHVHLSIPEASGVVLPALVDALR